MSPLSHPSRRLIVNADDFGLTPGINQAILELNTAGALTSATLMANSANFREAVHAAFVQTTLDIGCHIVLVDGKPMLPHTRIPSLASADGFRPTLGSFLTDLHRGRILATDIEAEAIAQIRHIQNAGLTVSHLDTHKHTHMFRQVLAPVLRAAQHCGVSAIRNPFEPAWSVRATEAKDLKRRLQVMLLRLQRGSFLRAVRRAGLATTDGAIGVLATGELNTHILQRLLERMPAGTWELVCHPGYPDAALDASRTRLRASRALEREALLAVLPGGNHQNIQRISFAALAPSQPPGNAIHPAYARR